MLVVFFFFFFKQKTAYEMRISDWSSDVCSSDLVESVITVTGPVVVRGAETVNAAMATGSVELQVEEVVVQARAAVLPLQVNSEEDAGEDTRLRYRYLDLRREKMQARIRLRGQVIQAIREGMVGQGFQEFQTPILTARSPEGARDYLVPRRLHPGNFYALPQAPQVYQPVMQIPHFDRTFHHAPHLHQTSRSGR